MDVYTIRTCIYIRIMVQCNHTNSMYYVEIYVHMYSSIVFTCTMRMLCQHSRLKVDGNEKLGGWGRIQ
jgi:hypothetical protein